MVDLIAGALTLWPSYVVVKGCGRVATAAAWAAGGRGQIVGVLGEPGVGKHLAAAVELFRAMGTTFWAERAEAEGSGPR